MELRFLARSHSLSIDQPCMGLPQKEIEREIRGGRSEVGNYNVQAAGESGWF